MKKRGYQMAIIGKWQLMERSYELDQHEVFLAEN
ncbi:arylsulfatase A-like enzyme [Catalinimonas alkaloidigena]|nr:arylsulfatase A-like enzyme [Catalinimonas alkaloidigena]